MPELPEVETVVRSLNTKLKDHPKVTDFIFFRKNLRNKIPIDAFKKLKSFNIIKVERRAKYILFFTEHGVILSHLGMTGQWRLENSLSPKKHDHIAIKLESGRYLIYSDPRRFGFFDFIPNEKSSPLLVNLGPEPLSDNFNSIYLSKKISNKDTLIKTAIMDQKLVVGVGNIYACEALFAAKVSPLRKAHSLHPKEIQRLVAAIKNVLANAINLGGSTIRDYKSVDLKSGDFQNYHNVYDKTGKPCVKCKTKIKNVKIGGRSTYWCPHCQI